MKNVLTPSRKKILDYLKIAAAENRAPSVREICEATGLKSTSTVHSHLNILEENGYITRSGGHRSIRMADSEPSVAVPVIGRVTAGIPVYAFEEVTGHIPFPAAKAAGRELFALNVSGESMRDIGILDGDIVICEKNPSAENGDIVVALIGDEATVKSFYRENGHFRLQPHNPDFDPIITDELSILGRVISLYREYG
ncbi:MAG: transcriptional repressor LexA [Clostridia bacterium]|nr:transcriptional repressor LexA [Clostridia bacterium]